MVILGCKPGRQYFSLYLSFQSYINRSDSALPSLAYTFSLYLSFQSDTNRSHSCCLLLPTPYQHEMAIHRALIFETSSLCITQQYPPEACGMPEQQQARRLAKSDHKADTK